MKITINNPITNEKHEITVATAVPNPALKLAIENIIDKFPKNVQVELGRGIVNTVNRAMKNNAVESVVYSDNIFVALAKRVTYGRYTIKIDESGVGYSLDSSTTVDKEVKIYDVAEKKTVKTVRHAFVTYADCVKLLRAINNEHKKNNIATIAMNGDFDADEMRKIRYFILCANGRLTDENRATLAERGADYAPFLEDKDSNNGKKNRAQIFYDIFNAHTGKSVKAIHHIENNVVKECSSYNTMYKLDKDSSESVYISALFNEWLNSELVTATAYLAQAPEKKAKAKKVAKTENTATAETK